MKFRFTKTSSRPTDTQFAVCRYDTLSGLKYALCLNNGEEAWVLINTTYFNSNDLMFFPTTIKALAYAIAKDAANNRYLYSAGTKKEEISE